MKAIFLAALLVVICAQSQSQGLFGSLPDPFGILNFAKKPCERDPLPRFKDALSDFTIRLTKRASYYSSGHFVISPYSIWLSLSSIAEYADKSVQDELFKALNLPEEQCIRNKFYQLALNLESAGGGGRFERNRFLLIDEKVTLGENFKAFIQSSNIISYMQKPFQPELFDKVQETIGVSKQIAMDGHSMLLDRLDYQGFWTSAFAKGTIERAPFYNDLGLPIATVDFMRMKSRVRLAHIPIINAKVLELPVGSDGKYSMLLTMGVNNYTIKSILDLLMSSIIVDVMKALTLSLIPIDVAVPRFSISGGYDARPMLEDMGFSRIFSDYAATSAISDPAALPGSYLQRVSINITSALGGRDRDPLSNYIVNNNIISGVIASTVTGLASAVGRDFIANKPFLFTLIENKSKVAVFTGVYSYPENPEE